MTCLVLPEEAVGRRFDTGLFACRLIAILHDEVTHDCPLNYASQAHLGPIVPTLKGRKIRHQVTIDMVLTLLAFALIRMGAGILVILLQYEYR